MDPILKERMDRVNKEVSLPQLVQERYKIRGKYSRDGVQVNCPFHGDSHPSAHVYESSNRFWCFACKELYDVTRFVARREQVSLGRAVALLEGWYHLAPLDEQAILMKMPMPRVVGAPRTPKETLKVCFRLLAQLGPYLTLKKYEHAFTAWWSLVIQPTPPIEQCASLLSRLQFIRDEATIVNV